MNKARQPSLTWVFPLLFLAGCSLFSFKYDFISNERWPVFPENELIDNPHIAVAILSEEGHFNPIYIKRGVIKYLRKMKVANNDSKLTFYDIGNIITIDESRQGINASEISNAYPNTKFALILWKNKPKTTRDSRSSARTIKSDGESKTVWDDVYKTTMSINAELILYDLVNNEPLAISSKNFKRSASYTDEHYEPSSNFVSQTIGVLEDLEDIIGDKSKNYPTVSPNYVEFQFGNYTYSFLKNINKK